MGTYMTLTQAAEALYFAGRLIVRSNGMYVNTFQPISADPLGTVRWDAAVPPNGVTQAFWPWGEERGTVTGNDRTKWGTYWRDSESSLDYGVNRYYDNVTGRFMTADPYGGSAVAGNPQSWNKYGYGLGDPVNGNDPTGLDLFACMDAGEFDASITCGGFDSGGGGDGGGGGGGGCINGDAFDPTSQLGPGCIYILPILIKPVSTPPPCQDDWGNVDQTLEGLGTNILSLAGRIAGMTTQDISALNGTIHSDVKSEMNTIMAAGTGNTALRTTREATITWISRTLTLPLI